MPHHVDFSLPCEQCGAAVTQPIDAALDELDARKLGRKQIHDWLWNESVVLCPAHRETA